MPLTKITTHLLAVGAVTSAKITTASIQAADLATGSITSDNIF